MILDANDIAAGACLRARVCIVGAGAAGISLALELDEAGFEVLLLESGGMRADADTQDLYAGAVADPQLHAPPDRYRQRRFGGSTTVWGGRCAPFDEIDFEAREHLPYSGWPLSRQALLPFYAPANRICEAGEFAYRSEAAFPAKLRPMMNGFRSEHFGTDALERFSCPTDFGARYRRRLRASRQVRVLLNANVTALDLNAAGTAVETVRVRTLADRAFEVCADWVVLATGGLEVPRLLLASRTGHPAGIGNAHDVVGRYYMCHLAGTIGTLSFKGSADEIWHGYDVAADGTYCRRRLALNARTQRRLGLSNFAARLHHPRIPDPGHRAGALSLLYLARPLVPWEYARRLYGDETGGLLHWLRHLRNVLLDPWHTSRFLWHWLWRRTLVRRKFPSIVVAPRTRSFSLDFHAEQQPSPRSRVSLSEECDALGVPRLLVDWRYTAADIASVRRTLALLAADIERSGIGRFHYDPDQVEAEILRYGAYGGHHIGTARMGHDRRVSVVDSDCRVHGVANLYIAGSAVFPTSSQANPTLTIVALALRLAQHLRARCAPPMISSRSQLEGTGSPAPSAPRPECVASKLAPT